MSHFAVLVVGKDAERQLSFYNENDAESENPKWDWYVLGGRYRGHLHLKEGAKPLSPIYDGWQYKDKTEAKCLAEKGYCDCARKGDIENWLDDDFACFAVLKEDEWYEREDGWFGSVTNDKGEDVWEKRFKELLKDVDDDEVISIYDCHS